MPPEAAQPWLDHVAAAALCVGETTALFDHLVNPSTTEALAESMTLPARHPWAGIRPSPDGVGDLLAALSETGIVEAADDVWRIVPAFSPLLTADAPQRSVIASLRDHGFLTSTRLRRALDAANRHSQVDRQQGSGGLRGHVYGDPFDHARTMASRAMNEDAYAAPSAGLLHTERPEGSHQAETLVDILRRRAIEQPDDIVYTHLVDGETEEIHLTFGELKSPATNSVFALVDPKGESLMRVSPPPRRR